MNRLKLENEFLLSFTTRIRTALINNQIYSKEDLINFAKNYDLKKLQSNCPNQLSDKSIKQLERFLPQNIPTVHFFYSQFPTRIQNYLKKNNIQSENDLLIFIKNQQIQYLPSKIGKSTFQYLTDFLTLKVKKNI